MAHEQSKKKTLVLAIRSGLTVIALWQFIGFAILLLLVWANEIWDFASYFYGETAREPNMVRALLASAAIILAAVIVVGHTYVQHRAIISGMLTLCSYCHRIEIDRDVWSCIEDHLRRTPSLRLTHGICPDCIEKVRDTWAEEESG